MRPDDQNNGRLGAPLVPERQLLKVTATEPRKSTSDAAANIVRGQINSIYTSESKESAPSTNTEPQKIEGQPVASETPQTADAQNPYQRTHTEGHTVQADQWKQYHSAWQDYYQKYYERYYIGQVHQIKQGLEASAPQNNTQSAIEPQPNESHEKSLSKDEAIYELKNNLVGKLRSSAKTVRKSRHFIPITAALCVMFVFLFLQYNRVIFSNVEAYVSPGNVNPANIIVDPTTEVPVGPEPKLIIPKINVDVPVVFNTTSDQPSQLKAMEDGVAWFGIPGANSKPGQIGNMVLSGHSSNDIVDRGAYKFIFARLEQMGEGDTVYVNYEGKRYTYVVKKKEVVKPTDVSKLVYSTDKPILTLITCTPLGTALNRLLVTAEQVSPDPGSAAKAPDTVGQENSSAMPGNSPTFFQRLFGAN
jgi:sortase A